METGNSAVYLGYVRGACITDRVERQVESDKVPIGRYGRWESRANQASSLLSDAVVSKRQVSEAWTRE